MYQRKYTYLFSRIWMGNKQGKEVVSFMLLLVIERRNSSSMNYDSGVNKAHSYDAYNFRMPFFIDFPNSEWMWILWSLQGRDRDRDLEASL